MIRNCKSADLCSPRMLLLLRLNAQQLLKTHTPFSLKLSGTAYRLNKFVNGALSSVAHFSQFRNQVTQRVASAEVPDCVNHKGSTAARSIILDSALIAAHMPKMGVEPSAQLRWCRPSERAEEEGSCRIHDPERGPVRAHVRNPVVQC